MITIHTGIIEYDAIAAGLADLRDRYQGVRFEISTVAGDKQARAARLELVKLRTAIETRRKELKAPALERSRLIDSVAKQITGEIEAIEGPIDAQIRAQEERKEAERQAKAKAEADRIAAIQARIGKIKAVIGITGSSSQAIAESTWKVEAMEIGDDFQELRDEAERTKDRVLSDLGDMFVYAKEQEERRAKLDADRAELDRQRTEAAAERKAEDDRRKDEQAEIDARNKATADRFEAERKVQIGILAAERAEFNRQQNESRAEQAERDAIAKAERDAEEKRIADERAELKRQQDEAQAKADAESRTKAAAENRAADRLRDAAPDLLAALESPILLDLISEIDSMAPCDATGYLADWLGIRAAAVARAIA